MKQPLNTKNNLKKTPWFIEKFRSNAKKRAYSKQRTTKTPGDYEEHSTEISTHQSDRLRKSTEKLFEKIGKGLLWTSERDMAADQRPEKKNA